MSEVIDRFRNEFRESLSMAENTFGHHNLPVFKTATSTEHELLGQTTEIERFIDQRRLKHKPPIWSRIGYWKRRDVRPAKQLPTGRRIGTQANYTLALTGVNAAPSRRSKLPL
jgi:hypothetical protein